MKRMSTRTHILHRRRSAEITLSGAMRATFTSMTAGTGVPTTASQPPGASPAKAERRASGSARFTRRSSRAVPAIQAIPGQIALEGSSQNIAGAGNQDEVTSQEQPEANEAKNESPAAPASTDKSTEPAPAALNRIDTKSRRNKRKNALVVSSFDADHLTEQDEEKLRRVLEKLSMHEVDDIALEQRCFLGWLSFVIERRLDKLLRMSGKGDDDNFEV